MEASGNGVELRTAANYISETDAKKAGASPFPAGSTVFPRVGAALQTNKKRILAQPTVVDDNVLVVTVDDRAICLPLYLFYWFCSINLEREFSNAGLVPSIPGRNVQRAEVPLPPLAEQRKIAEILSTWDRAIEQTESLIAAKERLKKGLMQRLLTGKLRFPEFGPPSTETDQLPTGWESIKAGDLFKRRSKKGFADEAVLSVTQDEGVVLRESLDRKINMTEANTETYKLVEPGDFVISLRSFQGGLEYSEIRGVVSPAYHVIRAAKPINDDFYRHYFKSFWFVGHLAIAVIGIRDGKQVSFGDFQFLQLPYPSLAEQGRIASVLNACDQELSLLRQNLDVLQQQKKGLMQKLLMGKVRVRIKDDGGDSHG